MTAHETIQRTMTPQGKTIWTLGNLLMLIGVYLLLYVGGLLADERYNMWAASGDSDIPLPVASTPIVSEPVATGTAPASTQQASGATVVSNDQSHTAKGPQEEGVTERRFHVQLNDPGQGRDLAMLVPQSQMNWGPNTISRIKIPKIAVDKKVQEVSWHIEDQNGTSVAIWDVAKYGVGHHRNSANPGQPSNIVLAGHSGGWAYPFNDLYYLAAGDKVLLWSQGQQYSYTVTKRVVVDESGPGVTADQRRDNAKYLDGTPAEQVTLITCWPLSGPTKFSQRVIVIGTPDPGNPAAAPAGTSTTGPSSTEPTSTTIPAATPANP